MSEPSAPPPEDRDWTYVSPRAVPNATPHRFTTRSQRLGCARPYRGGSAVAAAATARSSPSPPSLGTSCTTSSTTSTTSAP